MRGSHRDEYAQRRDVNGLLVVLQCDQPLDGAHSGVEVARVEADRQVVLPDLAVPPRVSDRIGQHRIGLRLLAEVNQSHGEVGVPFAVIRLRRHEAREGGASLLPLLGAKSSAAQGVPRRRRHRVDRKRRLQVEDHVVETLLRPREFGKAAVGVGVARR